MFQNTASLIIVFFSIALQASEQSANGYVSAPTVNLGYVSYAGYQNTTAGINYYRAIPYAQPPLGELRWKKPRPIELSNDFTGQTVDATQIGPACYRSLPGSLLTPFFTGSSSIIWPWMGQSENCLILDVLTPAQPVSSSLPVLVQIHGGGYTAGDTQTYPGDALVNASNGNIIYVSIQYRLGIFGFLGGSAIAEDGVLNAGLLDQRSALEWIQRNIRQFGGDPSRVTIWGGSAGGGSVSYQLIAGGAYDEPPFSAAIAEYPWWQPLLNASTQERQYFTALTLSNCSDLDCLRSLSSESLQTLNQAVQNASYPGPGNGFGDFWFGPVVDGKFIRRLPDVEYKTGNFYKVPLIVDRDAYEGYIFSNATDNSGTQEYETSDVSTSQFIAWLVEITDKLDRHRISFHLLVRPFSVDSTVCTQFQGSIRHFSNARHGLETLSLTVPLTTWRPQ